jgi:hypothetical protein
MNYYIPISGKDSLATAIIQREKEPQHNYKYLFNDVGVELPATYEWLDKVEKKLNISIQKTGKNLEDVIEEQGMLPSFKSRYCTRICKIEATKKSVVGKEDCIMYYGLRYDEPTRQGYNPMKKDSIKPAYPLRTHKIDLAGVYEIVNKAGLKPPPFFWEDVHNKVKERLGKYYSRVERLKEWEYDRLFAWRSRTNCYFCFYQRRYEWVGLLEHYPNLFNRAKEIEVELGSGDRRDEDKAFYWIGKGFPLSRIEKKAKEYKQKRVDAICNYLVPENIDFNTPLLFDLNPDFIFNEVDGVRSCGLLCGK